MKQGRQCEVHCRRVSCVINDRLDSLASDELDSGNPIISCSDGPPSTPAQTLELLIFVPDIDQLCRHTSYFKVVSHIYLVRT
jgi:hypothetical protein